ncbi:MAG: type II secretion system F family protein, partial [Acidimicrobiia bacterium]
MALTPNQFWLLCVAVGLAGFGLGVLLTGLLTVAAAVGLAVGTLPWIVVSRRRTRRLASVQESWPDGLRDLVASISSGASVAKAIEALTETGPVPLRIAFE